MELSIAHILFCHQVRELLRRKQSVEGADRLQDECEEVAARWKALHDAFKDK